MGLARLIGLCAELGSSGARVIEVAGEDWVKEGAEDELRAAGLGKSHPEDQDELEGVVEGEPIHSVDGTLKDGQEGVDDPVRQPLSIIDLAGAEQGRQRVITRNDEAGDVDEESASNVEEDQEEVEGSETKDDVDLGNRGLLLEVVEGGVFGQLLVELRHVVLGTLLDRHCG